MRKTSEHDNLILGGDIGEMDYSLFVGLLLNSLATSIALVKAVNVILETGNKHVQSDPTRKKKTRDFQRLPHIAKVY